MSEVSSLRFLFFCIKFYLFGFLQLFLHLLFLFELLDLLIVLKEFLFFLLFKFTFPLNCLELLLLKLLGCFSSVVCSLGNCDMIATDIVSWVFLSLDRCIIIWISPENLFGVLDEVPILNFLGQLSVLSLLCIFKFLSDLLLSQLLALFLFLLCQKSLLEMLWHVTELVLLGQSFSFHLISFLLFLL